MPIHQLLHSFQITKSTLALLVVLASTTLFSHKVEADVLFEGYYKVGLSGVHSGYFVQRYEFDDKKKEFKGSSFAYVKLSPDGKQYLNESLVAVCDQAFSPIKYQYSEMRSESDPAKPGKLKSTVSTIDASFTKLKDGRIQGKLTGIKNGKNYSAKPVMDKHMFLSNFLLYLMLQKGIQAGRGFAFEAIAEETGEPQKGQAQIKNEEKWHGISAYKMDWVYKDIRSISYLSTTGEALATEATTQGVSQELVATKAEAVANFTFPEKSIKALFGSIPEGKVNAVYKEANKPAPKPAPTPVAVPAKPGKDK